MNTINKIIIILLIIAFVTFILVTCNVIDSKFINITYITTALMFVLISYEAIKK